MSYGCDCDTDAHSDSSARVSSTNPVLAHASGVLADNPRGFARDLTAALARRLGGGLRASYVHGSAALGGWNAQRDS